MYYGKETKRAMENFQISNLRFPKLFCRALGLVKQAAAKANAELKLLDENIAQAISSAAYEVWEGKFDSEFVIDVFQTGSGTSTNMNANEIIASRASEIMAESCWKRYSLVHPNDHVNLCQSSNDVIPTAGHLAALLALEIELIPALMKLHDCLEVKASEFSGVIKTGRTHLQDAVPIMLGQEFQGYLSQIELSIERIRLLEKILSKVALGGTAVGTGINAHRDFGKRTCEIISEELANEKLDVKVEETTHHFQAQNMLHGLVEASAALKGVALDFFKISRDLVLMSSGPNAGLSEIILPELQAGSSIMPGKVNPVIPEAVKQVTARVLGNDATITFAAADGYFELNTMWPIAIYSLLDSISLLANASSALSDKCVGGIVASPKISDFNNPMLATFLSKRVGYQKAAEIAKESKRSGKSVLEVACVMTDIPEDELEKLLDIKNMTQPN